MNRNLKRTLLIIAIVSAAPFLATAAARDKVMETVGLTSAHNTGCASGTAADQATANGFCLASQEDAARHVPNPGKNRPLQFNFRRY
jgi:hypothetical protein